MKFPKRYFISLTLLMVLLGLAAWGSTVLFDLPTPLFGVAIFLVMYLVTFVSHMLIKTSGLFGEKPFVQMTILSMVIRMTIYILLILLLVILTDSRPIVDIVYFGVIYLILTIHELIFTTRNPYSVEASK